MKKLFITFATFIILTIFSSNASAAQKIGDNYLEGSFDTETFRYLPDEPTIINIFDNNLSTSYTLKGENIAIRFAFEKKQVFQKKAFLNIANNHLATVYIANTETGHSTPLLTCSGSGCYELSGYKDGGYIFDEVWITRDRSKDLTIYEWEIYTTEYIDHLGVSNLQGIATENGLEITWENPDVTAFSKNDIYLNNRIMRANQGFSIVNASFNNLTPNTDNVVKIVTTFKDSTTKTIEKTFRTLADTTPPAEVGNFVVSQTSESTAVLSFRKPTDSDFSHVKIYRNGNLIQDNYTQTSYTDSAAKDNSSYKIVTVDRLGNVSEGLEKTLIFDKTPPAEVANFTVSQISDTSTILSFQKPTDSDFSYVKIYRNGNLIQDNYTQTSYTDSAAKDNSSYKIVTVDRLGNVSEGVTKTFKFASIKVTNIKAAAPDFTAVELSWNNPTAENFDKVVIYRKENPSGIMARVRNLFAAGDGFTPIFETNGTTFKDLTVKDDTEYTYSLNSVIHNNESEGVTTTVKTPKRSLLNAELEDNGSDFVFKWDKPDNNEIEIYIDGKKYTTVPAADKQIVIPKADMVYDPFGSPKVSAIPINAAGNEGITTIPKGAAGNGSGGSLATFSDVFTVTDLIKAAMELIRLFGPFILLAIAFLVTPKFVQLVKSNWMKGAKQ